MISDHTPYIFPHGNGNPQTHCGRRLQLVSKKFLEEEIFTGTNFRELTFDRENHGNFCLAKISRYTVSCQS